MKNIVRGLLVFTAAVWLMGCAELKDKLPAPTSGGVTVHEDGWANPASPNFHGLTIRAAGWDMRSCWTCHGSDYRGGVAGVSCYTCHTGDNGPENCSTCHGSSVSAAPPVDLAGNTSSASPGVGAHATHLEGGLLAAPKLCGDCHSVPSTVYTPGHVDSDLPAEVPMAGTLARTPSAGVVPDPVFDFQALSCSNTYCHGNWKLDKATSMYPFIYTADTISGANFTPVWTGGSSEAACGTCHGTPGSPVPAGHNPFQIDACVNCHYTYADNMRKFVVDNQGRIADKSLHINGKINVLDGEYDF